jgi:hypothetical protein
MIRSSSCVLATAVWCSCQMFGLTTADTLASISLGQIQMELRSRSPKSDYTGTSDSFVMDLLSGSVYFLDKVLFEYFYDSDSVKFQKLSATIQSYDVHVDDGSMEDTIPHYVATVRLTAQAFFLSQSMANQDLVISVAKAAFNDKKEDFLRTIWDVTQDPFLRQISTANINVTGVPLNSSEFVNDIEKSSIQDDADTKSDTTIDAWLIALIASGGAFCIVFMTCAACVCSTKLDDLPALQEPTKSKSTASQETDDEESRHDGESEVNANTNFGTNAMRSPSTVHSITSQDSSIFTYNPRSTKSYTSNGSKTFGSGFFTANSGLEMDLQAWQNGGTVIKDENQIPFGQDISAISNKKDLSLIEEEDFNDLSGRLTGSSTQQYFKTTNGVMSPRQYLTEAAVQDLEHSDRWGSLTRASTSQNDSVSRDSNQYKSTRSTVGDTSLLGRKSSSISKSSYTLSENGASHLDLNGTSSDVINDLKDLSYQIDAYRQKTQIN